MKRIIEFLFFRWKREVIEEGEETWQKRDVFVPHRDDFAYEYKRSYIKYKLTNKFDGSTKIKKVYLN